MAIRKIIEIDEKKCDGCGQCVPSCAEGALQVINGKARLVGDVYCDGLGACLGKCPQDAITVVEREADDFDEVAAHKRLHDNGHAKPPPSIGRLPTFAPLPGLFSGCPGSTSRLLRPVIPPVDSPTPPASTGAEAQLRNWPVQLHLAPVQADYYRQARLLLAADCVPFALPDFHTRLLAGRILLIACPKLDTVDNYRRKLPQIFSLNPLQSIEIAFMEVPCCHGLVSLVKEALQASGRNYPVKLTRVGIRGEIQSLSAV